MQCVSAGQVHSYTTWNMVDSLVTTQRNMKLIVNGSKETDTSKEHEEEWVDEVI